jgi:hypothetical protein
MADDITPAARAILEAEITDAAAQLIAAGNALDLAATKVAEIGTALTALDDITPAGATAKPLTPDEPQLTEVNEQLVATWEENDAGDFVDFYQVYLNGSYSFTDVAEPEFVLPGAPGETVTIRVSAHNAFGYSPWTAAVSGTIPGEAQPTPAPTPDELELEPFVATHPIKTAIPVGVTNHANSAVIIAAMPRSLTFDTGSQSPPIYVGDAADPQYTTTIEGDDFVVRCPDGLRPGGGNYTGGDNDNPLVVFDSVNLVEYRMWRAIVNDGARTITCSGGGVSSYDDEAGALGRAEIHGQNTGSGCSYTVGMIRPHEIENGHIPHAIRVACSHLRSAAVGGSGVSYVHPATRTETSAAAQNNVNRLPMGSRLYLDPAFNRQPLHDYIDKRDSSGRYVVLPSEGNRKLAHAVIECFGEYGMCPLDGTASGFMLYFEGNATAEWTTVGGPFNAYGSYNDVARAIDAALTQTLGGVAEAGWKAFRVANPTHFNGLGL